MWCGYIPWWLQLLIWSLHDVLRQCYGAKPNLSSPAFILSVMFLLFARRTDLFFFFEWLRGSGEYSCEWGNKDHVPNNISMGFVPPLVTSTLAVMPFSCWLPMCLVGVNFPVHVAFAADSTLQPKIGEDFQEGR